MNNKKKNIKIFNQISKNQLIENDKISLLSKFGFIPIYKKVNSVNNKNNISSNITNITPDLNKFKPQIIRTNKMFGKSYSMINLTKNINNENNKICSRNYIPYLTTETATTKYKSSFNFSKKMPSYNNLNNNNKENKFKNLNRNKDFILNIKPIIKKEENIINSHLWHKLIKNIDQDKNKQISDLKNKILNNKKSNSSPSNKNNFNVEYLLRKEDNAYKNDIIKEHIKHKKIYKIKTPFRDKIEKEIKKDYIKDLFSKEEKQNYNEIQTENNININKAKYNINPIFTEENNNSNQKILDEFNDPNIENISKDKHDFIKYNIPNINNVNNQIDNLFPIHNINNKADKYINKFFCKNNSCDISSRDIKEEIPLKFFKKSNNMDYLFISEIEKKNSKIVNLNLKKFLNLENKCLYNILSFTPGTYLELINCNSYIKSKITNCLNNIFSSSINDFQYKYKNILEIIKSKFVQNKIKSYNSSNDYILDLILNCRIISKDIKKSVEIGCNYYSNKEKYDYVWVFDLQKKEKIKIWITSEINTMKNSKKAISYTSQVSSFSYLDEIQIQINIFNIKNIVNPPNLEWFEPIISSAEPDIYEKTKYVNSISYDPIRASEVEMQILYWSNIIDEKHRIIIDEIKEIFGGFFEIKNIGFHSSKYDFYKIVLIPSKIGVLLKNKFCRFNINIVDKNMPIKNEIQCIYFLNTNSYRKKIEINLGSNLIFYIIDMKVK